MKKLTIFAAILLIIFCSCNKEVVVPDSSDSCNCYTGDYSGDDGGYYYGDNSDYSGDDSGGYYDDGSDSGDDGSGDNSGDDGSGDDSGNRSHPHQHHSAPRPMTANSMPAHPGQ